MEIKKYRQMKTAGNILIGAGGILTVVGISTLAASLNSGNPQLSGVGGLAILGTGIHFASKGAKKQRELESLLTHFNIAPNSQGLVLTYTF